MSIRSGTRGFILCSLVILLTFFGGAAFGATNPYGTTITEGMWAQDGATDYNDGTITTTSLSTYYWGMRATNGSNINNRYRASIFSSQRRRGTIITTSDYAYGMWAEQNSTANNYYRITTSGNYAYGMYATGGSTINNNFDLLGSPYIRTSGLEAHGMVAEGTGSQAWNYADVLTTGESAYGMLATDGAQAYNIGISLFGFSVAGSIETEGEGSHGMVAEGSGSIAANVGSIETSGVNALGMKASDLALAINLGDIETSNSGSVGMGAENVGLALNLGEIETEGEGAHGMQAQNFGLAVNMSGLPDLDGLDVIPLPEDLLDILDSFGLFPGEIVTTGYGAHGMYAKDFSIAANLGDIFILGNNPYAYGMLAEDFSLALNIGNIEIGEYRDEDMGGYSHGMGASNWSAAINAGSITTYPYEGAYGMLAENNSIAVNAGSLVSLGGDFLSGLIPGDPEDPEDENPLSGIIDFVAGIFGGGSSTIETFGYGSHGMVARNWSAAINLDEIITHNEYSNGMQAEYYSAVLNWGSITTEGLDAAGMIATDFSLAANFSSDTIETWGDFARGMGAYTNSIAINTGSIITHGDNAAGMYAITNSLSMNFGDIETEGLGSQGMSAYWSSLAFNSGSVTTTNDDAYGMSALYDSTIINTGSIQTSGENAEGMNAFSNSNAFNFGSISTTGENTAAVYIDNGSLLINAGILNSERGNAVTAAQGSSIVLFDGTVLAGSHTLEDVDGDSDLAVLMDGDLAAQVVNFGSLTKAGGGTLLVEGGSSVVGNTLNAQGTIMIEPATQFETGYYTQLPSSMLYLYANPDSYADNNAIPLWVHNHASISGGLTIDMSTATMPGFYTFIRADTYDADFDTFFVNVDPSLMTYTPQWITGGSFLYTSMVGYSFSEAALGLVAAIDDWSMLRWVMANHLQDVNESMKEMKVGESKIHAQVLAGQTKRDPSSEFAAGFDSTQKGLSIGIDQKKSEDTMWGLYAGYTEGEIDFTNVPMAAYDWENQDTWHLGGYISKRVGKWILSDTLTYRSTDHDTFRAQAGGDATASFDSWAVTNDIRAGYVAKEIGEDCNWQVIPEIGLNIGYFERGGYIEKNGFTYGDFDTTVVESVLGIRFRGEYIKEDGSMFVPQFRLAWVHLLSGEDVTINQSWGGDEHWFTENLDDDYFVADIGMSLYRKNNMDISLNYNCRYSSNSSSHGGWLRFQWEF